MMLFTGIGRSGSWQIRAEQLGSAVGGAVVPKADVPSCKHSKLIVVVKRLFPEVIDPVLNSGVRWVWDVVDSWPQPLGRWMTETEAKHWLRSTLASYKPYAVVWPTERMMRDAQWEGGPQIVLPHHSWSRYSPQPLSDRVTTVGYEGGAHYLGKWRALVEESCRARGWRFELNNGGLTHCDIAVALRDAGGYPATHWKSNCKLANIQALGIPALCSPESGYFECASGAEFWVRRDCDIDDAFDVLESREERERIRKRMLSVDYSIKALSERYRNWLLDLAQ